MLLCSSHVFKSTPRSPKDLAQVHYLQVALQVHAILAPFTPCLETNFQKSLSEMTEGAQVHPFDLLSNILHTPSCTETHSLPPHAYCIKRIIKRCNTSSPPLSWSLLFCREKEWEQERAALWPSEHNWEAGINREAQNRKGRGGYQSLQADNMHVTEEELALPLFQAHCSLALGTPSPRQPFSIS